jgi:CBS domain-containing protein
MNARDLMTTDVVSVTADTSMRDVANILNSHRISAVPVIDGAGAPIGMISEGDLIGRDETDREARRDWWLALLAEGEELHPDFLATMREPGGLARDVMVSPVVTVDENTGIAEIARLLTEYRIKRVPVVKDARVVGIVSRADLVRALATQEKTENKPASAGGLFAGAMVEIDNQFGRLLRRHQAPDQAEQARQPDGSEDTRLTVADFRGLVADHERQKIGRQREHQAELVEQRRQHIAALINQHIPDKSWRALVHHARQAAEQGEKEFILLRFPSGLCSDGGRSINSTQPGWPETLRGEAAEIYLRWERDLKPHGFRLAAKVLDFPGGIPGDIGLFLAWGE